MNRQLDFFLIQRIFYQISPFLILPYIARIFGPEGIGQIALAMATFVFFNYFASLGAATYGQKIISDKNNKLKKKYLLASDILISKTILCFLPLILYLSYIIFFSESPIKILLIILVFDLMLNSIDTTWFHYALKNFKIVSICLIISRIISIILIYTYVDNINDTYLYLIFLSVPNFLAYVYILCKSKIILKLNNLNLNKIFKHLKIFFTIGFALSGMLFIAYSDKLMLYFFTNSYSILGFYDQINKFIMLPMGITMALSTFSITFYNKKNYNNNLVNSLLNLNILFTFTYFILLFFNGDQIIFYFLGDKFKDMLTPLVIYSYILPIKSINIFILSSVMIKEGKYILVSKLIYTALILNILANFFLIPKFELCGAIYSSIISEIYLFFMLLYFNSEKFLQNKYLNLTMLIILQFILIFSVNLLFENEKILKLIFSCIIGSPIILVYYFMFRVKKIAL